MINDIMKTLFVIGPSGVGKSTLTNELSVRLESVLAVDLDSEIKRRYPSEFARAHHDWERFWDLSISCIEDLKAQGNHEFLVIDVGAGSLQSRRAPEFFRSQKTVLIYDTPENTLKKVQGRQGNAWVGRSVADFIGTEYSSARRSIYNGVSHVINVAGRKPEESVIEFLQIISEMENAR